MPPSYFPLRWESTGDQWWYASPIDWAAANGHYDLVRELLHIDPNLIIKLSSLRRIRRLESVWDDDARFADVARCRSSVARSLLLECEAQKGKNTLIKAGYGGWLLYTAASAGDMEFVQELLRRDRLMVFGEGEFGVTDILYAAARSKNSEVFRLLYDSSMSPSRCLSDGTRSLNDTVKAGNFTTFRWEMLNRAVHAAARGGNLGILRELLKGCSDVLEYRDSHGSTVLHAASGRGQVEVVKDLVASFHIIDSRDNKGNTSLHVAAFRGHLGVVEALVMASPSSASMANNMGDTFLHLAVAGFRTYGFRRLDRQIELMRQLVTGSIVNIEKIINIRNNDGRTVLHIAIIGNLHSNLVNLLMQVRSINLNIRDMDGMTPLDLLSQRPRSALSDILIKQFISAGGISNSRDYLTRSAIVSQLKLQGVGTSPGTSFKVSDAEILSYAGVEPRDTTVEKVCGKLSSCSSMSRSDATEGATIEGTGASANTKRQSSVKHAAYRLKSLLHWPLRKEKKTSDSLKLSGDDNSTESCKKWSDHKDTPSSLRQQFSNTNSLQNNKRTLSVRNAAPSPSAKKKFAVGLKHGVIQAKPHLAPPSRSPSSVASHKIYKQRGLCCEIETIDAACPSSSASSVNGGSIDNSSQKSSSVNSKQMKQFFCFGAQTLNVEESASEQRSTQFCKRSVLSAT